MSDSVRPHRRQPTRLPHPWDSPGKNTGVDCHFLLQCMKVKSESEVAQSCLTLSDPMDCSPPGSSVHGIFQARLLEWGATAFSVLETRIPQMCNSSHPLWNQKVQPKCEWEARRDRDRRDRAWEWGGGAHRWVGPGHSSTSTPSSQGQRLSHQMSPSISTFTPALYKVAFV